MRPAVFGFLFVLVGYAQTGPPAGYILKCAGTWTASQNGQDRPLKAGTVVNPGDKLHSSPPDALLGLVLYDGSYLKCPTSDQCKQPIQIPARAKAQSTISAFLDRLQNRHLPPVAFVTSRSAGTGPPPVELRDAIVALAGGKLDLAPVVSTAPAVEVHLYLQPLDAPAGCGEALFTLPASSRTVDAADLAPKCAGLYQLSGTGDAMEGTYPATVLFVAPGQLARASRMLDESARVTAGWQSAGEDEKRTFRRLTLGAIQQNLESSK